MNHPPGPGSQWVDTRASDIPPSALRLSTYAEHPKVEYRRVVVVDGCADGRTVAVVGKWQEKLQGTPTWCTITMRRAYADVTSFGRRFKPDDQDYEPPQYADPHRDVCSEDDQVPNDRYQADPIYTDDEISRG